VHREAMTRAIEKTGRHVNIHIPSVILTAAFPLFAAENNALQMTLAVKEHTTMMIPCPEKGASGNRSTYKRLWGLRMMGRVQPPLSKSYQHAHLSLTHDCSVLSGTYQLKQGWIVQYCGTANPKKLSARLLEPYVSFLLLFIHCIFLKILYSRHDSITAISRSSHMVGPLKNSSN
jgi:hypothetical protein